MLELIFRGFLEWIYALLVEIWAFIADGLLDIMSLDFAYLKTHVPIIPQMSQILLAVGWALLLGNLVFQALKSMAAGLGFEGEDPKLLFSRTFVFAFLLMACPQICEIGLDLTSNIMDLLSVPNATDVELVNEGIFGSLTAAWLMAIICSVIVMFKVLGLVVEVAERYVILAMLTITAPLAFAMGGSKNTASIFSGWCRMFGSMCLLMVTNLVCCKVLFSVVSTVPSGLDVLPWMVLIFAIVKVAKKSDAIITRIGLNPAITGGPGKTLPGMLAYTVIRTAASQVVKGVGGGGSGRKTTRTASSGGRPGGSFGGGRFSGGGGRFGGAQSADSSQRTEAGTVLTAPASRVLHSRLIHSKPHPSRAAPPMGPRSRRIATPGRKTPPGLLLSKRRMEAPPSTPEAEPMEAAGVLNRPGGVLFLPAPGGPPAMCRLQAVQLRLQAHRIPRQRRRDRLVHRRPSSPTTPGPVRQEPLCQRVERSTPPHPGPASQERLPGIPRRSSQALPGPAPQVQGPRAEALRPSPV